MTTYDSDDEAALRNLIYSKPFTSCISHFAQTAIMDGKSFYIIFCSRP